MKNKLFYVLLLFTTVCNVRAAAIVKTTLTKPFLKRDTASLFEALGGYGYADAGKVEELLRKNPRLANAKYERNGLTPLLEVLVNESDLDFKRKVIPLLVEKGADVNAKDKGGYWTPLTMALSKGRTGLPFDVLDYLVKEGANVDGLTAKKFTPLMFAARHNRKDVVELLLAKNADRALRNFQDKTAADLAREEGHVDLATFIENYTNDAPMTKSAAKK
jgi:ankyrin repeat protein